MVHVGDGATLTVRWAPKGPAGPAGASGAAGAKGAKGGVVGGVGELRAEVRYDRASPADATATAAVPAPGQSTPLAAPAPAASAPVAVAPAAASAPASAACGSLTCDLRLTLLRSGGCKGGRVYCPRYHRGKTASYWVLVASEGPAGRWTVAAVRKIAAFDGARTMQLTVPFAAVAAAGGGVPAVRVHVVSDAVAGLDDLVTLCPPAPAPAPRGAGAMKKAVF